MKRIRQGNDFLVTWRIKRAGINEDLTQAVNMSLVASVKSDGLIHSKIVPFDIVDNSIVRIEVTPQIAQWEGIYNFVLKYEFDYPSYADNNEKVAVDKNMFIIVSRTAQADEITIIECESDVLIGLKGEKGDSAFTVWNKENGGNNTYDDWLAFLQSPATEIEGIVSANEAVRIENENTRKLNEIERKQSEETRLQNESARVTAEIDRESNEDTRSLNEATRLTNEDDRIENENQRVIDEEKREQLYDNTVILKGEVETLKTETETAKDNAITATNQINTVVIPNAETAIQNAIDVRTDYETVVKPDVIAKANYAQEQGDYAQAQGDYAKEQGEVVDGRISVIEDKVDKNIGWYGIEFDETIANSACRRIGSMDLHRQLPIQNRIKRCLLLNDGTVNYYLHDSDSTKKADGSDAILDGTDGQVMVEIPEHWRKFEKDGTKWRVKISDYNVSGFHFVPKAYRSAYEATVERSSLKLSSVVNMDADYRGGNNNVDWDGTYRTLLGRPATVISGTNFAAYARNRGERWCMDVYHVKKIMDWLYYIEYANFNSQLPFNPVLTAEGFKQGGLGDGVTTLNSTKWSEFNGYYPFVACGVTNSLGNNTGVVNLDMPVEYDPVVFSVPVNSYRGVEVPFGHIWKWTDGIKINIQADDAGGQSQLYVCEDPLRFQHSNYVGYDLRGLLPRANGYVSKMIMGEFGEVIPSEANGGSTTYFADYFYTSLPATGVAQGGVLFGGYSHAGAHAGLATANTNYAFASANTNIGSRLCFIPEN